MTTLRYDLARLPLLRRGTDAAAAHLRRASSTDPAAASPLRVAARVREHLESGWLSAIDRVLISDAMLTWLASAAGTGWARGTELAQQALELSSGFSDQTARAELLEGLRASAGDSQAMAAFFATLGPQRFLLLLVAMANHEPESLDLPNELRRSFVATATADELPPGFTVGLVAMAAAHNVDYPGEGGLALSFLFHGDALSDDVLVASIAAVIAGEHGYAADHDYAEEYGAAQWDTGWRHGAPALQLDFADEAFDDDFSCVPTDPMYALLGQLAGRPSAARAVFKDPDRAAYLFGARDVMADDGSAIIAAAEAAAAGPDIGPGASQQVLADAALVASAFVNHFGAVHADDVPAHDTASSGVASILAAHLAAAEFALGLPDGPGEPGSRRIGTAELRLDGRPSFVGAVFDRDSLEHVIKAAARTGSGVTVLATAVATYQRQTAARTADAIAAEDLDAAQLGEIMVDAARFEARVVTQVGDEAHDQGAERDAAITLWVGLAADVVGLIPKGAIGPIAGRVEDGVEEWLAGNADAADAETALRMVASGEQLAYEWARELGRAGVIDTAADVPDLLVRRGQLVPFAEAVDLLVEHGSPLDIGDILQLLDASGGAALDVQTVLEVMGDAGQPLYVRPVD